MNFTRGNRPKESLNIGIASDFEKYMNDLRYKPDGPYSTIQVVATSGKINFLKYYMSRTKNCIVELKNKDNKILSDCIFFGFYDIVEYLLSLNVIPDDLITMDFRWKQSCETFTDTSYKNPSPESHQNTILHFREKAEFYDQTDIVECIDRYYNKFIEKKNTIMEFNRGGSAKYTIGIGNQYDVYKKKMISVGAHLGFEIFIEDESFHEEGKEAKICFYCKKLNFPMTFMLSQRNGVKPFISLLYNEGEQLSINQEISFENIEDKEWWIRFSGVDPLYKNFIQKIIIKIKTIFGF